MSEKLKVFNGEEHLYAMWSTRMDGKIRKKGKSAWDAAKNVGPFQGFKFDPAAGNNKIKVPMSVLREKGVVGIDTPIAKSLTFETPAKAIKKGQEGGDADEKQPSYTEGDIKESMECVYHFLSLSVWDVIVENVSDSVLEDLLTTDGLRKGDGPMALKELNKTYATGTKVNMLLKFRKCVRLSMEKDCGGEFRKFDYEHQQLQAYFSTIRPEELLRMLNVLVYLEGLSQDYDTIRDRI